MNPVLILIMILIFSNSGGTPAGKSSAGKASVQRLGLPPSPVNPGNFDLGKLANTLSKGLFSGGSMPYFDTFKMELMVDRLRMMTDSLEKVNHLNQVRNVPLGRDNIADRVQDSLDAVRGFLYDSKSGQKIDFLSGMVNNVKKFGDIENLMGNMAPILSMLSNEDDK